MAKITVAAPVTASPPAKTPSLVVAPLSSAIKQPLRFVSNPSVVERIKGFGEVPIAMIIQSTSKTKLLSFISTGRLRPLSSGSPNSIDTHSIPLTQPFSSPSTRTGLVNNLKIIPSSCACSTSSLRAGNSSMLRRYTMVTSSTPRRFAQRAASIATLPPPTMTARFGC